MNLLSAAPRLAATLTAAAAVAAAVGIAASPAHAAEADGFNPAVSHQYVGDGHDGDWGDHDGYARGGESAQPILIFTGDHAEPAFVNTTDSGNKQVNAFDNGNRQVTALDNGNKQVTALDNGNTDRSVRVRGTSDDDS